MRKLGPAELGNLLEQPLVAVLATYRMDGDVLLSPVWHQWRDGGFDVVVGPNDVKLRHLRRDPRASYLVLDLTTDQTLAERNADASIDPASLTKLMTAYIVFQALREKKLTLEQELPVSMRAWAERKGGGSLMFIDTTMTPKVDELLKGLIVQSGNDAAVFKGQTVRLLITNVQTLQARKPAIDRFMKAYRETIDWMYSNPAALKAYATWM
jgi:hypothetical protein